MKNKPAGGLGSRVVNNSKSARKVEPRAMAIDPRGVSQIGQAMGNHATEQWQEADQGGRAYPRGSGYNTAVGANNNAKPTVLARGTQATHGPVAGKPAPQGRDILSDFGRDSAGVRGRR